MAALAKPVAIKSFALIVAKANVLNVFDLTRRKIVRFQLAIIEAKIAGAPIAAHSTSGGAGSGIQCVTPSSTQSISTSTSPSSETNAITTAL